MTRKRSIPKSRKKIRKRARKTRGGSAFPFSKGAKKETRSSIVNILKVVPITKYLRPENKYGAKIAGLKIEIAQQDHEPIVEKIMERLDPEIEIDELSKRMRNVDLGGITCSRITSENLSKISKILCDVEPDFKKFIFKKYETVFYELASKGEWDIKDKGDASLYRLFYQIITEKDLDEMIQILIAGYDPSSNKNFLTEEHRTSRLGELVHSYMYKIFAGLATKHEMTETVLNYSGLNPIPVRPVPRIGNFSANNFTPLHRFKTPILPVHPMPPMPPMQPGPFQDLRNLCLVMRDIIGSVNHLFRQELGKKLEIGNTKYCHSGGNMFYVMMMMLCYIHSKRSTLPTVYDAEDILEQIRSTFDTSLSLRNEKDTFYNYLDALMKNETFRGLIRKVTSSVSDLDFLCLTSNETLLNKHRSTMKDATYLMCGMLLEECGKALNTGSIDNIELKVILPKRTPRDTKCGPFTTSTRIKVDDETKKRVDTLLTHYLPQLNGIRLTANEIKVLHIYLIRIKVAMEQDCLSDELRKIFAEKLDFVIGSMESTFYSYKQGKFNIGQYYSLTASLHELYDILRGKRDDKSYKRMERYMGFNIMDYIDQYDISEIMVERNIYRIVDEAISQSDSLKEPQDVKGKGWFNLLYGIIFNILDPTTI
jgi:hypothetical protein